MFQDVPHALKKCFFNQIYQHEKKNNYSCEYTARERNKENNNPVQKPGHLNKNIEEAYAFIQ